MLACRKPWFRDRAVERGRDVKIAVHHGGAPGWLALGWDSGRFAEWFDEHPLNAADR